MPMPGAYEPPQYGAALPAGVSPTAPELPYGMGDCGTFMDIPPLVHNEDGRTCINPDFDMVTKFHLSAVARDPGAPITQGLVPLIFLPAGDVVDFQLTVAREENGMGHFLINELFMISTPGAANALDIEIKSNQGDKAYMNAPVSNTLVFGTSQLSNCLPCPILLWPNQTLIIRVRNNEAVGVLLRVAARGKRYMPYNDMSMVQAMERCWSALTSTPYWLGLDAGSITLAAGASAQAQMSVPGGTFFELKTARTLVTSPGAATQDNVLVDVTDGRVGRRSMTGPVRLGAHYAVPTLTVPGFPGGVFRAADAGHCPQPPQLFRGNTRILHTFQNTHPTDAVTIQLVYHGCLHYAGLPSANDLAAFRRFGTTSPVAEGFYDQNPLFTSEPCIDPCEKPEPVVVQALPPPPPPPPAPEVSMWRPNKAYYGPGSTGALPYNMSFARSQSGKAIVVIRDPNTNTYVRPATSSDGVPAWVGEYLASLNANLNGLGGSALGRWGTV